jgi:hypothetical protein
MASRAGAQRGQDPVYMNLGTRETHPSVWRVDFEGSGEPSRFHSAYSGPVPYGEVPTVPEQADEYFRTAVWLGKRFPAPAGLHLGG